jgi:D-glycero-alpha-D-manno-heptose-7-phosphate kinase
MKEMPMHQRMPFGDDVLEASAPCRIDMGGTLDLSTFYLPLRHFNPCTLNIALDMRTRVRLSAFDAGKIKVSSRGFDDLAVEAETAPFNHPLGLMLAVARYFGADGVHIDIHSASPPRSALGGSSVAAVALIWAFFKAMHKIGHAMPERGSVALLAHAIEQSVAGVPCGMQDQLAAVFGGVHVWHWQSDAGQVPYSRQPIPSEEAADRPSMNRCLLVAYCGVPHVSKDINGTWVRQFVAGHSRRQWQAIVECSHRFAKAVLAGDLRRAVAQMNRETEIRCELTPEVLDEMGGRLVAAARDQGCGARFTGAGGGGCVWAFGPPDHIDRLRPMWADSLDQHPDAKLLDTRIDTVGLL